MKYQLDAETAELIGQLVDDLMRKVDEMIEDRFRPLRQDIEALKARIEALENRLT